MASRRETALTPELLARLSAVAEEKRLRILDILRVGEHCVCDLTDRMDAGQSLLSHHLKVLREAGLVTDRRAGRWSYYRLVPDALAEVERFIAGLRTDAERAHAELADGQRADAERADAEPADGAHAERADGERADAERAEAEAADGERADAEGADAPRPAWATGPAGAAGRAQGCC